MGVPEMVRASNCAVLLMALARVGITSLFFRRRKNNKGENEKKR